MSLSNTALLGYDFTVSLADQMGNGANMTLVGAASRSAAGLLVPGGTLTGYARNYAFVSVPAVAQVQRPFTMMTVLQSVNVATPTTNIRHALITHTGNPSVASFVARLEHVGSNPSIGTRSGSSDVSSGGHTALPRSTLYNGTQHIIITEYRNNGATLWLNGAAVITDTSRSWLNFPWGADPQMVPWTVFDGGSTLDMLVRAQTFWAGTLTADDRTALQANWKAFYSASSGPGFRSYYAG